MPQTAVTPDLSDIKSRLEAVGQEHLLRYYDELPAARQRKLLEQIAALDIENLPDLIEKYVRNKPRFTLPEGLRPAPYYPRDPESPVRKWDAAGARKAGEQIIRENKVAAFTVAGGQGSRLGYDGPKGCFSAGPVSGKPLFAVFAEGIHAAQTRYEAVVPWYVMTSPLNHEQTVSFFKEHSHFGLDPDNVVFFSQGVMPSLDIETGRLLLAGKDAVATNPDGHGGSLTALYRSGALKDMRSRGIEQISYFQVDNPLVRVVDPVFIGLHVSASDSSGEMSSKMVPKAYPEEKMGVFCSVNGRTHVIEYSDLPDELARKTNDDGSLQFVAGSIAVHAISVDFVEKLNTDKSFELPYHRAEKAVAHLDPKTGRIVEPQTANAVKLERFVFDALPLCRGSVVYETERVEEFAPIKNAEGNDSPETASRLQTERAARWLEAVGVEVPRKESGEPDCTLEISPLTALEPADLKRKEDLPREIERGQKLAL